jgi:hypothetical protein
MDNRIIRAGLIALAATTIAACSDTKETATAPAPPPIAVTPAPQENAFGANFGTAFRTSETAAPVVPADGDIVPLSLTTDPARIG